MKVVRTLLIILLIAGAAVGGYFLFQRYQNIQAAKANSFETLTAANGDLTATVGGTGTVRANQTGVLGFDTTGTVQSVNVKVGDTVKAGDVLAVLDKSSLAQNIILAEADLVSAQRNLDTLMNSSLAQSQAQLTLANAQKALDDAKRKRTNLSYTATSDQIQTAQNNVVIANDALTKAQDAYDKVKDRPVDDPLRAQFYNNLISARQKRDQAQYNLNSLTNNANPDDIAVADAQVTMAESQLKDAQREWDRLKNGPDPQDIAAARARIAAIQATLDMQYVKAPFSGTITQVSVKPGDQAAPNTVAFRLDDLSHLLVDVQISEVDINRISAGQPVNMSFDAITDKNYEGKVSQVAQVGTTVQGTVNFNVTIELTNADEAVLPAMTAAVNIVVNQLHNILLVPNRAVRLRDSQRVVYVLRSGKSTVVNITLGPSSDTDSQVISGDLRAGDLIILNPPLDLSTSGSGPFGGR